MSLTAFLDKAVDIFIHEVEAIKSIRDVIPSITFQPITKNELLKMRKRDGNALGLEDVEGPLVILSQTISYNPRPETKEDDDAAVKKANDNIHRRCGDLAKEAGIHHPYQYANYADGGDDVFEGYGARGREWLKGVKKGVVGKGSWDVSGFQV